jgi:hypothetical protein
MGHSPYDEPVFVTPVGLFCLYGIKHLSFLG